MFPTAPCHQRAPGNSGSWEQGRRSRRLPEGAKWARNTQAASPVTFQSHLSLHRGGPSLRPPAGSDNSMDLGVKVPKSSCCGPLGPPGLRPESTGKKLPSRAASRSARRKEQVQAFANGLPLGSHWLSLPHPGSAAGDATTTVSREACEPAMRSQEHAPERWVESLSSKHHSSFQSITARSYCAIQKSKTQKCSQI